VSITTPISIIKFIIKNVNEIHTWMEDGNGILIEKVDEYLAW
jgi:hypothetical protein